MIKVKVSKNLRGSIILPTISKMALRANDELFVTKEQFCADDVQNAINKSLLVTDEEIDIVVRVVKITNLSQNTINLPKFGILYAKKSIEINPDSIDLNACMKMQAGGLLSVEFKEKSTTSKSKGIKKSKANKDKKSKEIETDKESKEIETESKKSEENTDMPVNMRKGKAVVIDVSTNESGQTEAKSKITEMTGRPARSVQKENSFILDTETGTTDEDAGDFLIDPRTGKPVQEVNDIIFVDTEKPKTKRKP